MLGRLVGQYVLGHMDIWGKELSTSSEIIECLKWRVDDDSGTEMITNK